MAEKQQIENVEEPEAIYEDEKTDAPEQPEDIIVGDGQSEPGITGDPVEPIFAKEDIASSSPIILPTLGRVVWFKPGKGSPQVPSTNGYCTAQIIDVLDYETVNLVVVDSAGTRHVLDHIDLVQDESLLCEDEHQIGGYAVWMPYQKGQAAKTESLEEALKENITA